MTKKIKHPKYLVKKIKGGTIQVIDTIPSGDRNKESNIENLRSALKDIELNNNKKNKYVKINL